MIFRKFFITIAGIIFLSLFIATGAWALDPPHDASASPPIDCSTCHNVHGTSYPSLLSKLCESCHFEGGPAPAVLAHSSRTTDAGYGNWDLDCWACHDPHNQKQDSTWGTSYGKLLKVRLHARIKEIDPNDPGPFFPPLSTLRTVTSSNVEHTSTATFVDGDGSASDDICQVCHESTTNYNTSTAFNFHNDYGADTQPGGNCVTCHPHGAGFSPVGGGCTGCHSQPQGSTDYRRQVTQAGGSGGDFSGGGGTSFVRDEFSTASYSNNDGTANWAGNWVDPEDADPAAGDVQIPAGSGGGPFTYRDEFASQAYNGTDGTQDWSPSPWVEDDNSGGGAGGGNIRVRSDGECTSGWCVRVEAKNVGDDIFRQADLSGANSATLTYDYNNRLQGNDEIIIEVSGNGGGSWVTLGNYVDCNDCTGSESFDITSQIAANTQIRFRVTNDNQGRRLWIDNVQIEYTTASGGGELRLNGPPVGGDRPSAAREVDLSSATGATFTFDFRTDTGVTAVDAVDVEVSDNGGGSYTLLEIIDNISGASSGSKSYDISAFSAANTRIRFRVSSGYSDANKYFYPDNVQIEYTSSVGGNNNYHHVTDGTITNEIVTDADCTVCHDQGNHQSNGEPTVFLNDPDGGTSFTYDGSGASVEFFCLNCHDADSSTAFDSNEFAGDGNQPFTDGRTPPDIDTDWTNASHNVDLDMPAEGCLACHGGDDSTRSGQSYDSNIHGSNNSFMLSGLVAGTFVGNIEEALCYACHDSGVASTNIESEFSKANRHPVVDADQSGNRAVECADCHNPHAADSTTASAPNANGPLAGVAGVDAAGAAVDPAVYQYEVCFRCHAAGAPNPAIARDMVEADLSAKFDTNNPSFHPVEAQGQNPHNPGDGTWVPSLQGSWSESSVTYCTDCHANNNGPGAGGPGPDGPHGSSWDFILERQYETADNTPQSSAVYALCYKCHSESSILSDTSFKEHDKHIRGEKTPCSVCHDPHGTQGSNHLINFRTDVVSPSGGTLEFVDNGFRTGECSLVCHGKDHNPKSY